MESPYLIPLCTGLIFPSTFLATYGWAVSLGHTDKIWPYISDTGTVPPESCFFGQMLNIGALLLVITVFIRYKQMADFYPGHSQQALLKRLNTLSMWLGSLGALGVSLVANFQETSVAAVHFLGAALCFGLGTIYLWVQVYLSWHLRPPSWPKLVPVIRVILAFLDSVGLCLTVISMLLAYNDQGSQTHLHWEGDEGREFHLISTISEWIMSAAFSLFILSFVPDFKNFVLESHCRSKANRPAFPTTLSTTTTASSLAT